MKDMIDTSLDRHLVVCVQSTSNTKIIVPEGSSRYGDTFVIAPKADHISICRPRSKISTTFNSLSSFLDGVSSTWKVKSKSR